MICRNITGKCEEYELLPNSSSLHKEGSNTTFEYASDLQKRSSSATEINRCCRLSSFGSQPHSEPNVKRSKRNRSRKLFNFASFFSFLRIFLWTDRFWKVFISCLNDSFFWNNFELKVTIIFENLSKNYWNYF